MEELKAEAKAHVSELESAWYECDPYERELINESQRIINALIVALEEASK